jgi:hypothetical protein
VDASNHDALLAQSRFQAIAGPAVEIKNERRRPFFVAAAAAGHHHVLNVGQFGLPVGASEMGERRAAADHFHQLRHFTVDVRRRDETVADGCRQLFDIGPDLWVLDVVERRQLIEIQVLAVDRHQLVSLRR